MKKEIIKINNERGDICVHRKDRTICRSQCNFCELDDFLEDGGDFKEKFFSIGRVNFPFGGEISLMGRKINIEYEMKIFILDINLIPYIRRGGYVEELYF